MGEKYGGDEPSTLARKMLAFGSVVGLNSIAGCLDVSSSFAPGGESDGSDGTNLALSYFTSHPSYPNENIHSGWVHIVSDGSSADLTFDAQFCDELGSVEADMTNPTSNEYTLAFSVASDLERNTSSGEQTADPVCRSVTRLTGGANVANDWELLTVAVNGVEIQSIERSGTAPELRPLPDPVHSG